jgi:hypothetical protein
MIGLSEAGHGAKSPPVGTVSDSVCDASTSCSTSCTDTILPGFAEQLCGSFAANKAGGHESMRKPRSHFVCASLLLPRLEVWNVETWSCVASLPHACRRRHLHCGVDCEAGQSLIKTACCPCLPNQACQVRGGVQQVIVVDGNNIQSARLTM